MRPSHPAIAQREGRRRDPLLIAGAMAGPLFYGLAIAQIVLRPGFDIMRHPLSLLSLGTGGWVQRAAFIAAGVLVLIGLIGMRSRTRPERALIWVKRLLAIFGLGTLMAGLFVPDPAFGFPPGTPDAAPSTMSMHSMLHGACFDLAFLAVISAMLVAGFARMPGSDRGRAYFSLVAAVALSVLIIVGLLARPSMGASFFAAGAVAFGWVSATFLRTLASQNR